MRELLTSQEVIERLAEIGPSGAEYDALRLLQGVYHLRDEGFINIEGNHCYPIATLDH